jgi:hypothetical protein
MRVVTALLLLAGLTAAPLSAQAGERDSESSYRMSITWGGGWTFSSTASQLATQLREAGYNHTYTPLCLSPACPDPQRYPIRRRASPPGSLTMRFRLTRLVSVAGGYTWKRLGAAIGRREKESSDFWTRDVDHILTSSRVTTLWVGGALHPLPSLRLGAGPGFYWTGRDHWVSRLGLLGEIGLDLPRGSRFFVDVAVRGHLVGSEEVTDQPTGITLQNDLNHVTLEIGLGLRF